MRRSSLYAERGGGDRDLNHQVKSGAKWALGIVASALATLFALWLMQRYGASALSWGTRQVSEATTAYWVLICVLFLYGIAATALIYSAIKMLAEESLENDAISSEVDHVTSLYLGMLSAFTNLDSLLGNDDLLEAERHFLTELMRDHAKALTSQVVRSYVMVPAGDYLESYVTVGMPDPDGYERRFYIGDRPDATKSITGECFRTKDVRVVHVDIADGEYQHDDPDFQELMERTRDPGYRSFICVPILHHQTALGVLCIDSSGRDIFDSGNVQELVLSLGYCIGTVRALVESLNKKHHRSQLSTGGDS